MSFARILLLFLAFAIGGVEARASERKLLVFAAASMRDVMEELAKQYEPICKCRVVLSFASSSILARQIEAGAPADVFISANRTWMDWLEARSKLSSEPQAVARNRLVIASTALTKDSFNILLRGRFSMGDPSGVPAGIYAKQALEHMGLWQDAKPNAVFTENVRVALSLITRGDLQSGIVYASDLKVAPDLHAHFNFPEESHAPIEYLAALINGKDKASENLLTFLRSDAAQNAFENAGFLKALP